MNLSLRSSTFGSILVMSPTHIQNQLPPIDQVLFYQQLFCCYIVSLWYENQVEGVIDTLLSRLWRFLLRQVSGIINKKEKSTFQSGFFYFPRSLIRAINQLMKDGLDLCKKLTTWSCVKNWPLDLVWPMTLYWYHSFSNKTMIFIRILHGTVSFVAVRETKGFARIITSSSFFIERTLQAVWHSGCNAWTHTTRMGFFNITNLIAFKRRKHNPTK